MLLEDDGQPFNAPGGHMQPLHNAESMVVNDWQQPHVEDFVVHPDVDSMPDNVDH